MSSFLAQKKGSFTTLFAFSLILCSLYSSATPSRISHLDLDIQIGRAIFEKLWVFAPSSTKSSDGLGPLYNARSCAQCHTPVPKNDPKAPVSLVIMLSIEPKSLSAQEQRDLLHLGFIPEPIYGQQIQTFAYPGAYAEAVIKRINHQQTIHFADQQMVQLHYSEYQLEAPAYGPFHADLRTSARIAPRMQGLGLLNAIPDAQITALADPDDRNDDGISGRANRVYDADSKTQRIGRFGWKAGKHSLEQQNLAALVNDIGISSWLFPHPEGDCTPAQKECIRVAASTLTSVSSERIDSSDTDALEASVEMTNLLTAFTRVMGNSALQAGQQAESRLPSGARLFDEIGCLACHSNHFSTTQSGESQSQKISPYSDLLLHDMGEALADNRREFLANGREWRTTPLWGIAHYLSQAPSPMFLHDGRATSVLEATLWHGGEAEQSKQRFMALPKTQREELIRFVESL